MSTYQPYYPDEPTTSKQAEAALQRRMSLDNHVKDTVREMEERLYDEEMEAARPKTEREQRAHRLIMVGAEKSRFTPIIFLKACRVIRAIRHPQQKLPRPTFSSDKERILTYELTICVLKYSGFLEQALDAGEFFTKFPYYKTIDPEDVTVVVYDLLEREFSISPDDSQLPQRFKSIQTDVLTVRTKVMAHIARLRIKCDAITMDGLLPEKLRHQHNIDQNPLYAWVNLIRASTKSIIQNLKELNFKQAEVEDDVLIQEDAFYVDKNHSNLIRFHSNSAGLLSTSYPVRNFLLVIQDKSACLYVYALVKAIYFSEHVNRGRQDFTGSVDINLLNEYFANKDKSQNGGCSDPMRQPWYENILKTPGSCSPEDDCVVVSHCGSGRSVAHLAVLLQTAVPTWLLKDNDMDKSEDLVLSITSKFTRRPPLNVIAFGVPDEKMSETYFFFRRDIGALNVKMYGDNFSSVSPKDSRVRGALAILVNPPSSGSALKDPVNYICSEGGDEDVLTQMSKFLHNHHTNVKKGHDRPLKSSNQGKFLRQALHYSTVKLVMYTTCSLLKSENVEVVSNSVSQMRKELDDVKTHNLTALLMKKNVRAFKDINFHYVNLHEILSSYPVDSFNGPFLEINPSSASSGGFIALIRRREDTITISKNVVKVDSQAAFAVPASDGTPPLMTPTQFSRKAPTLDNSELDILDINELLGQDMGIDLVDSKYTQGGISKYLRDIGTLNHNVVLPPEIANAPSKELTKKKQIVYTFGRQSELQLANAKKQKKAEKGIKKANVIDRIAVPTHSSMAKQKQKWRPDSSDVKSTASSRPTSRSASSQRGSIKPADSRLSRHPSDCVCARHAKKFPDFKPL